MIGQQRRYRDPKAALFSGGNPFSLLSQRDKKRQLPPRQRSARLPLVVPRQSFSQRIARCLIDHRKERLCWQCGFDPQSLRQDDLWLGADQQKHLVMRRAFAVWRGIKRQKVFGAGKHLRFREPQMQLRTSEQDMLAPRDEHAMPRLRWAKGGVRQIERLRRCALSLAQLDSANPKQGLVAIVSRENPVTRAEPVNRLLSRLCGNHRACTEGCVSVQPIGRKGQGRRRELRNFGIDFARFQRFGWQEQPQPSIYLEPVDAEYSAIRAPQEKRYILREEPLRNLPVLCVEQPCLRSQIETQEHGLRAKTLVKNPAMMRQIIVERFWWIPEQHCPPSLILATYWLTLRSSGKLRVNRAEKNAENLLKTLLSLARRAVALHIGPMSTQLNHAAISEIFRRFEAAEPNPEGELHHVNAYTLLVAVALSAQATDVGVNKATRPLFARVDTPEKMLALGEEGLIEAIKTIGLFRQKAKNVIRMSQILIEEFAGEVPSSRAALQSLPGVGRKTANVVLNMWFGHPAQAVDTHVFRLANRSGIAPGRDVLAVERAIEDQVPVEYQRHAHHWLILHGRYICLARKPKCNICPIRDICLYEEKTP